MTAITITLEDQGVLDGLDKVIRGLVDFRELGAWKAVRKEFHAVQNEKFQTANNGQWQKLSPAYEAVKASKYGGPTRILIANGDMVKEFTTDAGKFDEQAQEMTFEFSSPAGFHMSKAPRSKIPYLSSLDLTEAQEKRIAEPITKKLKQLIANARLKDARGF